jgi:hypothetical protein
MRVCVILVLLVVMNLQSAVAQHIIIVRKLHSHRSYQFLEGERLYRLQQFSAHIMN